MPKWLNGMIVPTLMLGMYAVASCIVSGLGGGQSGSPADLASGLAFPLIIASWVTFDARKRGHRLCYDYDSFVFFAWPIVVPVYLFRTRGTRAFLTLAAFVGLWLVVMIATFLISAVREFVLP
jgi:hypothetical protein